MKSKLALLSILLALLITAVGYFPAEASLSGNGVEMAVTNAMRLQSNENAPDCFSMDIVFIIDQSRSMSRQPNPNDPLGQRFNAPRYALDWLANNRLSRMLECPDMVHRIGIISFGTKVQTQMDLTPIYPMNGEEWAGQQKALERKIEGLDMEGTDPALAFTAARDMLRQAAPLGSLPRKRGIILLTDGQPCVPGRGCGDIGGSTTSDQSFQIQYMQDLATQIGKDFPFADSLKKRDQAIHDASAQYGGLNKIPDELSNKLLVENPVSDDDLYNSTYIWVVAMNDASPYLDKIGSIFDQITNTHNGKKFDLKQNLAEIPSVFNQIMSDLAGVKPVLLGCGNLPVNPYLSSVALDIYKAANGLEVQIKQNTHQIKNGEGDKDYFHLAQYSTYGAIEHYRFNAPPAGIWEIVCSDPNGAEVSYQPFNAQVKMTGPGTALPQYNVNGAKSDPSHPYFLEYKITDMTNGLSLNKNDQYPPQFKAVVKDPNGGESIITQFDFKGDGVWKASQPLPVNLKGDYSVLLTVIADCVFDPQASEQKQAEQCPEPQRMIVRTNEGKYAATDVQLFQIKIISPANDGQIALHGSILPNWLPILPVKAELQLVDLDGNPVHAEDILNGDPNEAMTAALVSGSNRKIEKLTKDPTDSSRFTTVFDSPSVLGKHTLTVTMGEVYRFEKFRPQQNQVSISFTRKDPLLQDPFFYRVLVVLALVLLALLVILFIYMRTYPLAGTLNFARENQTASMGLGRGKRWFTVGGSAIPSALRSDFKKISVMNRPTQGRGAMARKCIQVTLNNNPHKLVSGQSCLDKGWTVNYSFVGKAVTNDRFLVWTAVTAVVTALLIALVFIR